MEKSTTVGCEKMIALFDAGTFVEIGAYMKRASGELTGVVCGYGAVDGKLVYAFVQDSDRQKGAFDALQAEKIAVLYGMAMKNGAPVVGFFDSIGAFVGDGASVMSAYGKLLKVVSDASGMIPQIAVISGVCSGMAATVAAMFDVIVTVKEKSKLFVNAPFVTGKDVGSVDYVAQNGLASVVAESKKDANRAVATLLTMLPSNSNEGICIEEIRDNINRKLGEQLPSGRALIAEVADCGQFFEIGADFAPEMRTGLIQLGGATCGVIANDPSINGGAITVEGAKKAAKWISLCDGFSVPVVTLVDSVGVEGSAEAEDAPLASQLGKLAMAYATANTAKITVVVGKAYGAAFTLMGSKALGADMVYALPSAEISVMAPESAVAFLWNARITEQNTRADLVAEWKATNASAENAAADGSVDDLIDPTELRQRICSAVYMLLMKNDATLTRKHCNLPL